MYEAPHNYDRNLILILIILLLKCDHTPLHYKSTRKRDTSRYLCE